MGTFVVNDSRYKGLGPLGKRKACDPAAVLNHGLLLYMGPCLKQEVVPVLEEDSHVGWWYAVAMGSVI